MQKSLQPSPDPSHPLPRSPPAQSTMAALTQSKVFAAVPLAARRMLAARRVSDLWGLPAGLPQLCLP